MQNISSYSVRMWENVDQKNSKYGHFSRSFFFSVTQRILPIWADLKGLKYENTAKNQFHKTKQNKKGLTTTTKTNLKVHQNEIKLISAGIFCYFPFLRNQFLARF